MSALELEHVNWLTTRLIINSYRQKRPMYYLWWSFPKCHIFHSKRFLFFRLWFWWATNQFSCLFESKSLWWSQVLKFWDQHWWRYYDFWHQIQTNFPNSNSSEKGTKQNKKLSSHGIFEPRRWLDLYWWCNQSQVPIDTGSPPLVRFLLVRISN